MVRGVRPNTSVQTIDPATGRVKSWETLPGRRRAEPDPEHVALLTRALEAHDATIWNDWRTANPDIRPELSGIIFPAAETDRGPVGVDLSGFDLRHADLSGCELAWARLGGTNLVGARLRGSYVGQAQISHADLRQADLTQCVLSGVTGERATFAEANMTRVQLLMSTLIGCDLSKADLEGAELDHASLPACRLRHASLRNARLSSTDFASADLAGADLGGAHLIGTNLAGADLTGANVFATSCWDVRFDEHTRQRGLVVTLPSQPRIEVDDVRLAQFVHLLLTSDGLRSALTTMGDRAVLLLGRFREGGLDHLRAVAAALRERQYLPMIFDFERPDDRAYTDVVRTLGGLAKFVIVDLSGPSVPHELASTVPLIKTPFVLTAPTGYEPYAMLADLYENDWVIPIVEFSSTDALVDVLDDAVIAPAEAWIKRRRRRIAELYRR